MESFCCYKLKMSQLFIRISSSQSRASGRRQEQYSESETKQVQFNKHHFHKEFLWYDPTRGIILEHIHENRGLSTQGGYTIIWIQHKFEMTALTGLVILDIYSRTFFVFIQVRSTLPVSRTLCQPHPPHRLTPSVLFCVILPSVPPAYAVSVSLGWLNFFLDWRLVWCLQLSSAIKPHLNLTLFDQHY